MRHQAVAFIEHWIGATGKHGIHSPFVYDLVTQCFNDKTHYDAYPILDRHRKLLLEDRSMIEVTDLGAGSLVFKSNMRKVASIAKNAGISRKRQRLLYRLVHYFSSETIWELGTSLGMATLAMSLGHEKGRILTVEGCLNTSAKARALLDNQNRKNVEIKNQSFDSFLAENRSAVDLVYIDGNHDGTQTFNYFEQLLPFVKNDTVLIFDDIYWSPGMTHAWKRICEHPVVTVSIDTFQWGLIFFRREQEKQHFRIRV
ncbi:MAG: class I SAM-dependent methyltransferase [Bacteroidota bacterium]